MGFANALIGRQQAPKAPPLADSVCSRLPHFVGEAKTPIPTTPDLRE